MKKLTPLLAALLLLTACGGNTGNPEPTPTSAPEPSSAAHTPAGPVNPDEYGDYFVYPLDFERALSFTLDEDGIVYLPDLESSEPGVSIVKAYGFDGGELEPHTISVFGVSTLCAGGGKLFFTAPTSSPSVSALYSYDLQTGKTEELMVLERFSRVKKTAYWEHTVYILAIDPAYDSKEGFWDPAADIRYSYDGTILAAYHASEGRLETVYDGKLENFAVTPEGKLLLYAYDGAADLYFQELDPADGFSLGPILYRKIHSLSSFAADGQGVIYGGMNESSLWSLKYWPLAEEAGVSEMTAGTRMSLVMADSLLYYNGFTFLLRDNQLQRYKNAAFIKDNPAIRVISAGFYGENISAEGYNVSHAQISRDEFALTVLSRDQTYDICYVPSWLHFAENIKTQGSFYPLNEVPGVREWIGACFPFIQDAATDEDGNIWMIPVMVEVDAILYNGENCREAGLDFAGAATAADIIENVRRAAAYSTGNSNYRFIPERLLQRSVTKYLRNNSSLDTPEFRQMAESLKGFLQENTSWGSPGFPDPSGAGYLFDNFILLDTPGLIDRDDLSLMPVTGADGVPNSAQALILCVNPYSGNLAAALEYVSAVCAHLLAQQNTGMLADPSAYTDSGYMRQFYALHANSVIDFNLSDEVFADDFDRYLRDEISLDTLIWEAGRKLAMYRGE
ncbi:MAG: hypothetical protein FWG93_02470 [Oscillospiraceae bacterium]|nr:hypothetical protein [Oscillospiraceae bacterium]